MFNFDIRTVTNDDVALVRKLMNDPWMQEEMRTRHLGIAAESNFCLQMWKWCLKILEFVDVSKQVSKFGIAEIESKMTRA